MFLGTMRSTKSRNSTNFAMINGARQPPRPTPSMVNYSDEDSAKGYDENPDDSDSLTEKPSEISSTDSQVCLKNLYQFWKLWKFFKVAIFCKLKKKKKKKLATLVCVPTFFHYKNGSTSIHGRKNF